MRTHCYWLIVLLTLQIDCAGAAPYAADAGPRQVASLEDDWQDVVRNRDVPVLICYPKDAGRDGEKLPVIVFSHGLGGTREGYAAYGEQWASYGYVVIFPQHHGSDMGVIGHGMYQMLMGKNDVQPFIDRDGDIHFVIDQIEKMEAGKLNAEKYEVFRGALDVEKIGMAGHSFGAITTQAIVGEAYLADQSSALIDKRVKAGIAMSGTASPDADQDAAFGEIAVPMLYLTGTLDRIGLQTVADRRVPFDHSKLADTYLITFNGADHMTFVPRERWFPQATTEQDQMWIRESTTAFWDAYLKGNVKAKRWLTEEFPREMGSGGVFEAKPAGSHQ